VFSSGIVLSPAVYVSSTPVDASTRGFGAYGVGRRRMDRPDRGAAIATDADGAGDLDEANLYIWGGGSTWIQALS
jgi:hypothetical protein